MFSKQKRDALLVRTYFNHGEYLSLGARLRVRLHRCSRILSHRGVWLEQRLPTCTCIYTCVHIHIHFSFSFSKYAVLLYRVRIYDLHFVYALVIKFFD